MIIKSAAIFMPLVAILIAQVAPPRKQMKYSVLAIEYVGDLDKPIPPIIISDEEVGAEYYQKTFLKPYKRDPVAVHVVNGALMERLIAQAELFERTVHAKEEKVSGRAKIVSVTIITAEGKKTFLYGTKSAISYLDSLKGLCRGDESLRSDIVYFQKRIRR
jgi:hypothetical protein